MAFSIQGRFITCLAILSNFWTALGLDFSNDISASRPIDLFTCCNNASDATAFTLVYGASLASYIRFVRNFVNAGPVAINYPIPLLTFVEPNAVVRPNQDTLYTPAALDLSHTNVVLTIPAIPNDRYHSYAFYDLYGNNYANLGSVAKDLPGEYLIRRVDDVPGSAPGRAACQSKEEDSSYKGCIYSPTSYGTFLSRILATPGNQTSIHLVNTYQRRIKLTALKRPSQKTAAPSLYSVAKGLSKNGLTVAQPAAVLSFLAMVAPYNQAEVPKDNARVAKILRTAGLVNGTYTTPKGVNLHAAALAANVTIDHAPQKPGSIAKESNKWINLFPQRQGNFLRDYDVRAYIAKNGYLELVPAQELYPFYSPSVANDPPLPENKAYLFTFSRKPPISSGGFWSLTVYNAALALVPNKLQRHALSDRSNLTYADGAPVYGPHANPLASKPFQILLQAKTQTPPKNWTSNWLPGPVGGGPLSFNLRLGAPGAAFLNGSYVYPRVEIIDAILHWVYAFFA